MSSLKNYFVNLNIFESLNDPTATDEEKRRQHRLNINSTRICFIVISIVLFGLTIIMKTRSRNVLITVENPNENQFVSLPSDAHCPCSRISLTYGDFFSIQTQFHQVCSSDIISDRWIKAINFGSNTTYFSTFDFRTEGSAVFQSLATFCQLSKDYTDQSIDTFSKDLFISQEVLRESAFKLQTNVIIQQFQSSAHIEFATQLDLVRKIATANRFLSALQTNYKQWYTSVQNDAASIEAHSLPFLNTNTYSICTCRIHLDCSIKSSIVNQFNSIFVYDDPSNDLMLMAIPGMIHGCLPVNTMLLSTLECFYNQTCFNDLVSFLPTSETFTALSQFERSRYELNSTMRTIIDDLMIEEWVTNISYEKYYNQCAPISCTYFKNTKYEWTFVLTQIIGLLSTVVMVCILIIENIIKRIRRPAVRNQESIPCKFSSV